MISKNIFKICFCILVPLSFVGVKADDHVTSLDFSEFHYFNVTNPMGFVSALDKHYASDCAAEWQAKSGANVSLWQISGSDVTHMVYVGYTNYEKMEIGRDLFSSCPESAEMLTTMNTVTNPDDYHNVIFEGVISRNPPEGIHKFYAKFDINIESGMESRYAEAWLDLMEDRAEQLGDSHYGINRVPFGNGFSTHYVYFGGDSLPRLMANVKSTLGSKKYREFVEEVGDIRELNNTTLAQFVKAFPARRK